MAVDTVARALALSAGSISEELSHKADLVNGTIPLSQIPPAAIEREVVVANDTARFALTTAEVQLGDTVKVTSTNKMYLVVDTDHLDGELGYSVYVAGKAAEAVADQNGDTIDTTYVKIVPGKQLSTEDYTPAEKAKLAGLENYDDSDLQTAIAEKVDKETGKGLSTEDFSTAEKEKLAGLENYDDTAVKSQIGELADAGTKNLLKVNKPTTTVNGITFTVNDDSSITINGTATGGNAVFTITDGWSIPTEVGKKYTASLLSGTADVYMPIYNTSWVGPNVVGSTDFTENSTGGRLARITVKDGTVVDNLTVYPMVCFTEIYQASSAFVPYAPSNYELYKMILALQNGG